MFCVSVGLEFFIAVSLHARKLMSIRGEQKIFLGVEPILSRSLSMFDSLSPEHVPGAWVLSLSSIIKSFVKAPVLLVYYNILCIVPGDCSPRSHEFRGLKKQIFLQTISYASPLR